MKNTALYYVQTNGTDAVNRRRFSLEELEYQNQGCPEGWRWELDNVQTDARRSFADVPHVSPVLKLRSFIGKTPVTLTFSNGVSATFTRIEKKADSRTLLECEYEGSDKGTFNASEPVTVKPETKRCDIHHWQDAFNRGECPYCEASKLAKFDANFTGPVDSREPFISSPTDNREVAAWQVA